jgi:hypothetical protein
MKLLFVHNSPPQRQNEEKLDNCHASDPYRCRGIHHLASQLCRLLPHFLNGQARTKPLQLCKSQYKLTRRLLGYKNSSSLLLARTQNWRACIHQQHNITPPHRVYPGPAVCKLSVRLATVCIILPVVLSWCQNQPCPTPLWQTDWAEKSLSCQNPSTQFAQRQLVCLGPW